jgi:hypothetical protein
MPAPKTAKVSPWWNPRSAGGRMSATSTLDTVPISPPPMPATNRAVTSNGNVRGAAAQRRADCEEDQGLEVGVPPAKQVARFPVQRRKSHIAPQIRRACHQRRQCADATHRSRLPCRPFEARTRWSGYMSRRLTTASSTGRARSSCPAWRGSRSGGSRQ